MFNPLAATTIGALEQTIAFTERRHELLAGNIANLSTPDYRSRDLDVDEFQTELARSIREPHPANGEIENSSPPLTDWPGVLPGMLGHPILSAEAASASGVGSQAKDPRIEHVGPTEAVTRDDRWSGPRSAMESIVYHDGSDVSLEEQVNKISKNKHLHNLAISTMRNQFDLLRAAITERA
ncbi:flagellar basal body rod protein FlgB [Rhodopirellula sallentina]|uniref:Flagellar basal-body rod protein FlgB n=1 Tax=Rhodopirellula sallentina SM41 TaxID=1263870 RepID=M5UGN9_9BACT|nr:flagellar biosynthesis protein FlgB [Rhodopirellula sallentina]EMI57011.1 flagellar basal-body rod protein FlgB [Rhodopirellula sallentina SM41]